MNNDKRTHGLWEAFAPPAPKTRRLTGDHSADVIVIGGGYTGCSAALHLAQAGRKVVVLEEVEVGFGGSGRNVGLVNAGMWVMPDELPAQLGETFGERLLTQLGDAPNLVWEIVNRYCIECEANPVGTLHCAVGEAGLREVSERARQWQALGADVELLEGAAAHQRIGSEVYSAALLDRRAGTIQPLAYVRGLAAAAISEGVDIFVRSPALSREDCGDSWRVTTGEGSVRAPWVIVATDAYSTGICSSIREEQVMLPYFNLATHPLPAKVAKTILPERQGAWDTKQILSSFRFDHSGRLVFGSVGALRGSGTTIHKNWGRRELRRLFPQLERVEFEYEWYGMIGMTDNALPRFHRLDRNVISISAYNGRGIAPGTTFGRDLALLALGEADESSLSLPLTESASMPFRSVKAGFYEVGAQAAHLVGARF